MLPLKSFVPIKTPSGTIKIIGKVLNKNDNSSRPLNKLKLMRMSLWKNKAAIDALITAGSTAITKKYKAIGKPAKVPKPFAAPATSYKKFR